MKSGNEPRPPGGSADPYDSEEVTWAPPTPTEFVVNRRAPWIGRSPRTKPTRTDPTPGSAASVWTTWVPAVPLTMVTILIATTGPSRIDGIDWGRRTIWPATIVAWAVVIAGGLGAAGARCAPRRQSQAMVATGFALAGSAFYCLSFVPDLVGGMTTVVLLTGVMIALPLGALLGNLTVYASTARLRANGQGHGITRPAGLGALLFLPLAAWLLWHGSSPSNNFERALRNAQSNNPIVADRALARLAVPALRNRLLRRAWGLHKPRTGLLLDRCFAELTGRGPVRSFAAQSIWERVTDIPFHQTKRPKMRRYE